MRKVLYKAFNIMSGKYINVFDWNVKYRRIFLLTLPISLALWLIYALLSMTILIVSLALFVSYIMFMDLWNNEPF